MFILAANDATFHIYLLSQFKHRCGAQRSDYGRRQVLFWCGVPL